MQENKTDNPAADTHPTHALLRWAVMLLLVLFAAGIVLQLFLAGMGVLVDPTYFRWHVVTSRMLGPPLILAIALGLFAKVGMRVLAFAAVAFVLYGLQFAFIHAVSGTGRALHVVNALVLFTIAQALVHELWRLLNPGDQVRRIPGFLTAGASAFMVFVALLAAPLATGGGQQMADMSAAEIYVLRCAACHGPNGGGGSGPALAGNPAVAASEYVEGVITNGLRTMPGFGRVLSTEQISDLAAYVAEAW